MFKTAGMWFITIAGQHVGSLAGYHRLPSAIAAAEFYAAHGLEPSS
ncbi:hypothetical protein [Microbacterium sp. No. 7]|nr:hypothetical protein [Microbacterium sp. No. 7]